MQNDYNTNHNFHSTILIKDRSNFDKQVTILKKSKTFNSGFDETKFKTFSCLKNEKGHIFHS